MTSDNFMYAQMGVQTITGITNFILGQEQSATDRMMQKYRNAMAAVANAVKSDTYTKNEIAVQDATVRASAALQTTAIKDRGVARVQAAGAGVGGAGAKNILRGLQRSYSNADTALQTNAAGALQGIGTQRKNTAILGVAAKEVAPIRTPSVGAALLGLGTSLIDIYDQNQPAGSTLAYTLNNGG